MNEGSNNGDPLLPNGGGLPQGSGIPEGKGTSAFPKHGGGMPGNTAIFDKKWYSMVEEEEEEDKEDEEYEFVPQQKHNIDMYPKVTKKFIKYVKNTQKRHEYLAGQIEKAGTSKDPKVIEMHREFYHLDKELRNMPRLKKKIGVKVDKGFVSSDEEYSSQTEQVTPPNQPIDKQRQSSKSIKQKRGVKIAKPGETHFLPGPASIDHLRRGPPISFRPSPPRVQQVQIGEKVVTIKSNRNNLPPMLMQRTITPMKPTPPTRKALNPTQAETHSKSSEDEEVKITTKKKETPVKKTTKKALDADNAPQNPIKTPQKIKSVHGKMKTKAELGKEWTRLNKEHNIPNKKEFLGLKKDFDKKDVKQQKAILTKAINNYNKDVDNVTKGQTSTHEITKAALGEDKALERRLQELG